MQATEDLVRNVVQQVLSQMRNGHVKTASAAHKGWGVFDDVESAVTAAAESQQKFEARGLEDRRKAVSCIRKICIEQAAQLGRDELEETKIGRLDHTIEKLIVAGKNVPGVEFLRTDAASGENGVTLVASTER